MENEKPIAILINKQNKMINIDGGVSLKHLEKSPIITNILGSLGEYYIIPPIRFMTNDEHKNDRYLRIIQRIILIYIINDSDKYDSELLLKVETYFWFRKIFMSNSISDDIKIIISSLFVNISRQNYNSKTDLIKHYNEIDNKFFIGIMNLIFKNPDGGLIKRKHINIEHIKFKGSCSTSCGSFGYYD